MIKIIQKYYIKQYLANNKFQNFAKLSKSPQKNPEKQSQQT
jgi:hypothetical protein